MVQALDIDPKNSKSYYRRAKANKEMENMEEASVCAISFSVIKM